MRFRVLVTESLRSMSANLSTSVAATVTVLIGMFLLGLFIALGSWAMSFSNNAKDRLEVKVFFCTELTCEKPASAQQINQVRLRLESDPLVKSVEFVSKEEALAIMRKRTPELVRGLASNPLPPAYEITPQRGEDIKAIAANLRSPLPAGVEKVKDGEEVSDRVLKAARVISSAFAVATAVLLIASVLLIANTIRLSIFARRREIEVMKLVGATNWFVRGPFMLEGLICGLLGSVAAIVLLLLGRELLLPTIFERIDTAADVQALGFGVTALILLGVGLLVGAAGSGLTMRRFLQI